jgi:hypothetical protein
MIPADIDPSLCTGEPTLDSLDDGFSPPAHDTPDGTADDAAHPLPGEPALTTKSLF